ncbi:MAG: ATP-binding cassette domain-containing protein [Dehalococcoidia bacterium]|nr:ATP-binding cassette domain-containing protein [Dehalococcoidia bacterium]
MIQAHQLAKHFGAVTAVTDVTFEVEPGQILAMLGPNGAGKTTSIRMLAALLRPSFGRAVAGALNIALGTCLMTLPKGHSLGDGVVLAVVNWCKGAAVFVPLLLAAAVVEANITPWVTSRLMGA